LADVVARMEAHERLPADPWLELVPPPSPGRAAVAAFPAHFVIAADVDRPWIDSLIPEVDFAAPLGPPFLRALEQRLTLTAGTIDAVLLAEPLAGDPPIDLTPVRESDHPRVRRARRHRTDLRIWTTAYGVLMLGRGVAGRWESAVEVHEGARNRGHGRALASAARHLVPDGRPVWGQVAPGNAASLRVFLAAGYIPVGAEVLLTSTA
jgi:GNAT superfamily N-acetyltransferase